MMSGVWQPTEKDRAVWNKIKWKYKLPIFTSSISFLISLPFFLGVLHPSIHGGNFYSALYAALFITPPIALLDLIVSKYGLSVYGEKSILGSDINFILVSIIIYILLSFLIGFIIDLTKKEKHSTSVL